VKAKLRVRFHARVKPVVPFPNQRLNIAASALPRATVLLVAPTINGYDERSGFRALRKAARVKTGMEAREDPFREH